MLDCSTDMCTIIHGKQLYTLESYIAISHLILCVCYDTLVVDWVSSVPGLPLVTKLHEHKYFISNHNLVFTWKYE